MDPIWISIAFLLGLVVKLIGLPPLVGYLIAGFILNGIGIESGEILEVISDLGITLLLFTIGLKFKIKDLIRSEIWAGAVIHSFITVLIYSIIIFSLSFTSFYLLGELNFSSNILISFAMSFSSTVFAVKVLEEKGAINALYGRISIGILIIQDIFAVIFLVLISNQTPSPWLILFPFGLILLKPILFKIMNKIGHGELLILYGLFLALILGAELFQLLGLKPDLGALIIGMIMANHSRANEMANSLLNFKDIFLIGFFLSIGLSGMPNFNIIYISLILVVLVFIKFLIYFIVFVKFRLRARTSFHTSISLANFSEFGLIVVAASVKNNILDSEWLTVIAVVLSLSFIIAAPINYHAHRIYSKIRHGLNRLETKKRLNDDQIIDIGNAQILIFGLGRIGSAAYNQLTAQYGQTVLGIDYNYDIVTNLKKSNKNVVQDDATDSEFWERIESSKANQVNLIMFCIRDIKTIMYSLERLKDINYNGAIAAVAEFDDQVEKLKQLGVNYPFNIYTEAGVGFADNICDFLSCDLVQNKVK